MQHTLKTQALLTGIGLHTGAETKLVVKPAAAGTGIIFVRTDVTDRDNVIQAKWSRVFDTRLCTVIGNDSGVTVGTIEHIMAALAACAIDNAIVELDGPEVPILDGSSAQFIAAFELSGRKALAAPRRAIKILQEVTLTDGDKAVTLKPSVGMRFQSDIDFKHPSIGFQTYSLDLLEGRFHEDVADARTFGFLHEVSYLRSQGLALGGSLDNAIVLDQQAGTVLNPEGLRYADEFARHKLLDAVGDLYLAGGPILGTYHGIKAGHALNNQILRALFAQEDAFVEVDLFIDMQTGLMEKAQLDNLSGTRASVTRLLASA
jgi:UDP-3-O-[3-hydroxymyristoyl] N-acetylglucosamine deacetylase